MQEIDFVFTSPLGEIKTATYFSTSDEPSGSFVDGSSIKGFRTTEDSDLYLKPEKSFIMDGEKWVVCNVLDHEKKEYSSCPRTILKKVLKKHGSRDFRIGSEIEFFLTRDHEPVDEQGYFSGDHDSRDLRKSISRKLVEVGISPTSTHHEVARSQHEVNFEHSNALETADNVVAARMIIDRTCYQAGFEANFMPKPFDEMNGSGMHCHVSVWVGSDNLMHGEEGISGFGRYFINGLLHHAKGLSAITNPTINSYRRLTPGFEAPSEIRWGERDRTSVIRVPAFDSEEGARIEYRAPDSKSNPYLVFAGMILAGMDGVDRELEEPRKSGTLPLSLEEALNCFEEDRVLFTGLGEHFSEKYVELKREECQEFEREVLRKVSDWERKNYYGL